MKDGWKNLTRLYKSKGICFIVLASKSFAGVYQWGLAGHPFEAAFSKHVAIGKQEQGNTYLTLAPQGHKTTPQEIYFSFDSQEPTKSYFPSAHLLEANYKAKTFPDSVGLAASFENPSHKVRFSVAEHLFLAERQSLADFSIFFLLKPYQLKQNMPVMKKIAIFEGKKYGFEVTIREGRLHFNLYNLFSDSQGKTTDFSLVTQDSLTTTSFQTILLTYETALAKLTLYLQGQEQTTQYTTENRQARGSRLRGQITSWDHSPVILGEGFSGALDEIILRNGLLPADYSPIKFPGEVKLAPTLKQEPGVFYSKVYDLGYSASEIFNVRYTAEEPEATRVRVWLRTSDKPFSTNSDEFFLPFIAVKENPKFTGRFYQYKVELFSDPTGTKTPLLLSIKLESRENHPPQAPRGLQIAAVTPESVTLHFLRNTELDVIQGGRYHIYYGLRPYETAGIIRYLKVTSSPFGHSTETINDQNSTLETQDPRLKNRIQVTITNQMIQENLLYSRNKPKFIFPYPLLQKDVPYYFWVTACDNAYSEAAEYQDHESAPSLAVVARPE